MIHGLLERDDELDAVQRALDGVQDGEGRLLLIEGPAGIGKSRLLAEVRRRADRNMTVLAARAGELEGSFPFGVVRQLFEGVVADPDLADRALGGAAASSRAVLAAPELDGQTLGNTSFAVLHGLYWLALNLAEDRPLVLAIDDLHWVDRPSLRFLAYLVRRLEGAPVLVAATLRTAEPGMDPALLAEMAQDPMTVPLRPRPLSGDAVAELSADVLGEGATGGFLDACRRATGGNPLLLRQLLAALAADGVTPTDDHVATVREIAPRAVSRTVLSRLARGSADAFAVARAVAVLGESAGLQAVASLAELDETQAAEATGELVRAELLRPEPPLGFVHPLLRDAVYQDLPPGQRDLLHARAAQVLADTGAPPEQTAAQLLLCPPRGEGWVVAACRAAAAASSSRGAPDSAAAYLLRALEEPPAPTDRPAVLLELGMAEAHATGPGAVEHLTEALAFVDDPLARADITQMLGRVMLFTGDPDGAADAAREAMAGLPADAEEVRRSLEALVHMTVYFGAGDPASLDVLAPYHKVIPGAGVGTKLLQSMAAYTWSYQGGSADDCTAVCLDCLLDGQMVAFDSALLPMAAMNTLVAAGREEVLDIWEHFRAEAHRSGSLLVLATIHLWYGYTLYRRGELDEAREMLTEAVDTLARWGFSPLAQVYPAAHLAMVHLERGEPEDARRLLDRVGDPVRNGTSAFFYLRSRAATHLALGDPETALQFAAQLRARCWIPRPVDLMWFEYEAQALHRLGRTDEALTVAREGLDVATAWGTPNLLGPALRVLGELEGDDGLSRLQEAVDVLRGYPAAKLEEAKALAAYGAALRRDRKLTEAREPLRRALELASACGAPGLAEQARTELHASGARPRTDALSGVEALTPSERRVVDLAASGQANREIAQTLYVTPKTVEVHLTNAYRKLGVRSRRELGTVLTRA
ncbi:AAA family ATPase [Svornostia abyssi]|uniref:AAA family ATPase n=1 Tax=Svornostia abyssi TaxID=2898438 RepID=A0ABY5PLK1_9ACTN|nr:AAA family ATPase [Parviterribacteraceae bacterium J379]